MYRPAHFAVDDPARLHALVRDHPFATLVSAGATGLTATHLPFLLHAEGGGSGRLFGHVARANSQWRDFDGRTEALAIFQGPHAYVSPAWMPSAANVPTWNYLAVHAYGRPRVVEDPEQARAGIEALVATHEAFRSEPWTTADAPADFVEKMLRGIVAFEIPIERLEGKWKLSQNKSDADRAGIVSGLEVEGGASGRSVAAAMRRD